jgi:hypothetical protein
VRRIRLVHWKREQAAERIRALEAAGYAVECDDRIGPPALRAIRDDPPAAVVIDMARIPSRGRDFGLALRHNGGTRRVPLVFAGGDPAKIDRVKEFLPDAVYTPWSRIRSALRRAIAHPPAEPAVPRSVLAGYEGTPLPKKLGVKTGSTIALSGAPAGFEERLGNLPDGATVRRRVRGKFDLTIWFARSRTEVEGRIDRMREAMADGGSLWIAWPKKASGVPSDLSQAVVREVGLASGLVDYKVCSIDDTWSGLRFARRKRK